MSESQSQPPQNVLNALQIFANAAWHLPSTFWRTHRSSGSRDIEYLYLQDHSVALQYLFGSAFVWYNKILVRDEYREAFQALQTDSAYKQGVYIIGQPGIGKTSFLVYALLERLREHKPVAVQLRTSESFYVFFTNTCTPYALSDVAPLVQDGVWALSDLSTSATSPLGIFQAVAATLVQTTLPSIKYWERCDRRRGAQIFVLNTWSQDEIVDFSSLLDLDVERTSALAAKWGAVPQTLLEKCTNDESQQDWELRRTAAFAAKNYATLHAVDVQDVGATSTVFFVVPLKDRSGNICRSRFVIRVPTPALCNALMVALQQLRRQARIDFFLTMFDHPATRSCARNIYANWFHSLMTPGRQLTSTWGCMHSYLQEALSITRDCDRIPLDHLPTVRDAAKPAINPPYYWIPPTGEFPGIDCVIVGESQICVVHLATHFSRSSPQIGLDKLQQLGLPVRQKNSGGIWYFTFVGITDELARTAYERCKYINARISYTTVDPAEIGIPNTPVVWGHIHFCTLQLIISWVYTKDDELDGE